MVQTARPAVTMRLIMGVEYRVDDQKIEIILGENYSVGEVIDATERALEQAHKPLPILVDVTKSTEYQKEGALAQYADFLSTQHALIVPRLALVVAQAVRYGIARQLGAYLELKGIESLPFYDRDQAIHWLLNP
jgi:hypothetical protein